MSAEPAVEIVLASGLGLQGRGDMATGTPICDFGWKAVDFTLPATDGRSYSIIECAGPNGLLVAFICNPCPYVKAIIGRLVRDASRAARCGAQGEGGREAAA